MMMKDDERLNIVARLEALDADEIEDPLDLVNALCNALRIDLDFDRSWSEEVPGIVRRLRELIEPQDQSDEYKRGFDEGFASADDWYAESADTELAEQAPVRLPTEGERLLDEAKDTVTGERADQYGDVEDCFSTIAQLWSDYLETTVLKPRDVANMMCLLKVARNRTEGHRDNWIDIAGYAACGAEVDA